MGLQTAKKKRTFLKINENTERNDVLSLEIGVALEMWIGQLCLDGKTPSIEIENKTRTI